MSLNDELLLVNKVRSLQVICNAFDGVTTFDQRREKVRGAVSQVPDVVYRTVDGKNITLQQQFERIYGVSLGTNGDNHSKQSP